jgi:preprotein translocase subunit SecE
VARDRKRAKQRRDRGRAAAVPRDGAGKAPTAAPAEAEPADGGLERVDVPGALDHASANVDEFDAALVRGAGGVPVPGEDDAEGGSDNLLQTPGGPPDGGGRGPGGGEGGEGGGAPQHSGAPLRGGNRAIGFLRASWAELQRVQWPDRRQVSQATAVVVGFVAIAGAYLGLADYVAKEIVEFIL